jgi:hypothetical protein
VSLHFKFQRGRKRRRKRLIFLKKKKKNRNDIKVEGCFLAVESMDRLIRVEKVNNPMGRATMSCSTSILFFDSLLSVLCVVGLRTNNSISLYSCLFSLCLDVCTGR